MVYSICMYKRTSVQAYKSTSVQAYKRTIKFLMSKPVDHDSRIPFYIQVMDDLRQDIGVGVWLSGQRIPGEHELSETYGVSRAVVRQA